MDRTGRSDRPAHWLPPIRLPEDERSTPDAGQALPALAPIVLPRPPAAGADGSPRVRSGLTGAPAAAPPPQVPDAAVAAMARRFLTHGAQLAAAGPSGQPVHARWETIGRARLLANGVDPLPSGEGPRNLRIARAVVQASGVPPADVEATVQAILADRRTRPDALGQALASDRSMDAQPALMHALAEHVFGPGRVPPLLVARAAAHGAIVLRDALAGRDAPDVHPATVPHQAVVFLDMQGDFATLANNSGFPWNMVLGRLRHAQAPGASGPSGAGMPPSAPQQAHVQIALEDMPAFAMLRRRALDERRNYYVPLLKKLIGELRHRGMPGWEAFEQRPRVERDRILADLIRDRGMNGRVRAAVRWAVDGEARARRGEQRIAAAGPAPASPAAPPRRNPFQATTETDWAHLSLQRSQIEPRGRVSGAGGPGSLRPAQRPAASGPARQMATMRWTAESLAHPDDLAARRIFEPSVRNRELSHFTELLVHLRRIDPAGGWDAFRQRSKADRDIYLYQAAQDGVVRQSVRATANAAMLVFDTLPPRPQAMPLSTYLARQAARLRFGLTHEADQDDFTRLDVLARRAEVPVAAVSVPALLRDLRAHGPAPGWAAFRASGRLAQERYLSEAVDARRLSRDVAHDIRRLLGLS